MNDTPPHIKSLLADAVRLSRRLAEVTLTEAGHDVSLSARKQALAAGESCILELTQSPMKLLIADGGRAHSLLLSTRLRGKSWKLNAAYVPSFIAALMVAASTAVTAQEANEQPIQEVFQTQLVYPQERGEMQLTSTSRYGKGDGHSILQTPFSLEYGITDRWQVEVEWDAQQRRTEVGERATRGTGDVSIGTQYSFMNMTRSSFHTAAGFEITLPVADIEKELTEGFVEYESYFVVARDSPGLNNLQVFSQVGIGIMQRARRRAVGDEKEPAAHELNLGVGMFVPFRRAVFTGEFNLSTNRWNNGGQEREMYMTPGMVLRLPRNWDIGVGAPIGLTRDTEKLGAVFKLIYEFNVLGRDEK